MSLPLHRQDLAACLTARRRGSGEARWMISLADVLAVCLCALVLQYALSVAPPATRDAALSGLRASFGGPAAEPVEPAGPAGLGLAYWSGWFARRVGQEPLLGGIAVGSNGPRVTLDLPTDLPTSPSQLRALAQLLALSGQPVRILWHGADELEAALALRTRLGGAAQDANIDLAWISTPSGQRGVRLEVGA